MRTRRIADDLIAELRQVLSAGVVDEDRAYALLADLTGQYHYGKSYLAAMLDLPRQRLFRILASRQPELAPYRAMCGNQSSVLEVVAGMTQPQRHALLKQFEQTGRPFSQATLRRFKREWRTDKNEKPALATPAAVLRTRPLHWQETQMHDDAFLDMLEKAIRKGQQELQRRGKSR